MISRPISALVLALLVSALLPTLVAAEATDPRREGETVDPEAALQGPAGTIDLPMRGRRRDVLYSLVDELEAQEKLAELAEQQRQRDLRRDGPSPTPEADDDTVENAVRFAAHAVSEVEALMNEEAWENAMLTAERRLGEIETYRERFPDNRALQDAESLLGQYYILAEDRKLYEEARAEFESLGLRVEGVVWSAEQPSLAIISGEPVARGVNERVRNRTVIKNIDQNRVDFLFTHRQRQYHFQLYLEPPD